MDRDSTIDALTAAFADGSLSIEEFERRVELANRTDSGDILRTLLDGLPRHASEAPPVPARAAGSSAAYLENPGRAPALDEIVSIFSTSQRVGRWTAPRKLEAVSVFGSGHVDLREALIPREGMRIEAVGVFGSTSIILPEGVNVRVKNFALFGAAAGGGTRIEDPSAPIIEIEAVGIFGNVAVTIKRRE